MRGRLNNASTRSAASQRNARAILPPRPPPCGPGVPRMAPDRRPAPHPRITLEYTNVRADRVGARHGFTAEALERAMRQARPAIARFAADRKAGAMAFHTLPYVQDAVVRDITRQARAARQFDDLVVLGIGGSALGASLLQGALRHPEWNLLPAAKRGGRPRLLGVDKVEPHRHHAMLLGHVAHEEAG